PAMAASRPQLSTLTFPALTGLRALAAALVFFFHWFFTHADRLPLLLRAPFAVGYVGVPIFFALSGFLITLRYGPLFLDDEKWGWAAYGRYYWRRIIRIVPLYLLVLLLFVFAFGRPKNMMPADARQTVILLTLSQAFFVDTRLIGTTVGWTLTLEMVYYALAPLLVRFVGVEQPWLRLWGRTILLLALGLLLVWGLAQVPAGAHPHLFLAGEPLPLITHYSFWGQLGAFLSGQLAATALLQKQTRNRLAGWGASLSNGATVALYGALVWLALDDGELGSASNHALVLLIACLASVLILGLALLRLQDSSTFLTRVLRSRLLVYLGLISFALYLVQLTEPVQWLYWVGLGVHAGVEDQVWRAVLLYGLVTGLALLLFELVEKPLHQRLRRYFRR
ncbi:MAG: acyltransferase, partial [Anaerolineales bacterium]|nr:acyltransferase [Anaerolineales bacterium]